jgi:hypothetical protein
MQVVILQPIMDTMRDFHSAPPWMNFPQCYHTIIISTINSWTESPSVLARYVQLLAQNNTKNRSCGLVNAKSESN